MSSTRAPSPYVALAPSSVAPVVLTCEHATHRLPWPHRPSRTEREILTSHWGWDIGGWALTRDLAQRLRTSAIGGRWSRLVVDLNRRIDDPSLIRPRAGGHELSWNADIDLATREQRIVDYHIPYHIEVDRLIMRRLVREVHPLLFAVHTFTPVFDGRTRPFDVGVLYERHRGLAHWLGRSLRDAGLSVRYNQPYSGMAGMMYSADRHGSHYGVPCLELEVNHALFERNGAAQRLGSIVAQGLTALVQRLS